MRTIGEPGTEREIRFWQKFDHCCIYLMIAGSYAPTALLVFDGYIRWALFAMIWTIAIVGCLLKIYNRLRNAILSLTIYIAMGALIVPLLSEMADKLPLFAIGWMLPGGFVVAGASSHYVYNYFYLFA